MNDEKDGEAVEVVVLLVVVVVVMVVELYLKWTEMSREDVFVEDRLVQGSGRTSRDVPATSSLGMLI